MKVHTNMYIYIYICTYYNLVPCFRISMNSTIHDIRQQFPKWISWNSLCEEFFGQFSLGENGLRNPTKNTTLPRYTHTLAGFLFLCTMWICKMGINWVLLKLNCLQKVFAKSIFWNCIEETSLENAAINRAYNVIYYFTYISSYKISLHFNKISPRRKTMQCL